MVRPGGFELPTFWFVARRSIQLSYGRTGFNYFSTAPFLASTTWLSGPEWPDLLNPAQRYERSFCHGPLRRAIAAKRETQS
jgi:hypothetical protein